MIILATGQRARVYEYFDDTWIVVKVREVEMNVRKDQIQQLENDDEGGITKHHETPHLNSADENGIRLAFKEIKKMSGETNYFEVHLLNETAEPFYYEYQYLLDQTLQYRFKKEIIAFSTASLHAFKTDQLNDHPIFKISCWLKNAGPELMDHFECEIKLKPKQFFQKTESIEYKTKGSFTIQFIEKLPPFEAKNQLGEPGLNNPPIDKPALNESDHLVLSKAAMPDFVDLHAEKIIPLFQKLDAQTILNDQLSHFRSFLEEAIKNKLHKIYVVHGIGTGKLKAEIEKLLIDYPEVKSYNNHHTVRFGFGATEILLE